MKTTIKYTVLLSIFLAVQGSFASSLSAWEKHDKEVISKCMESSSLKNAKPAGEVIKYDDSIGLDVVLIGGNYPQKHMKNKQGLELCLFNRTTKSVTLTDAENLIKK